MNKGVRRGFVQLVHMGTQTEQRGEHMKHRETWRRGCLVGVGLFQPQVGIRTQPSQRGYGVGAENLSCTAFTLAY